MSLLHKLSKGHISLICHTGSALGTLLVENIQWQSKKAKLEAGHQLWAFWSFYFSGMQNVQPPSLPQKGCYVLD